MENNILGVGTRLSHPSYGKGVVIAKNLKSYSICFMEQGVLDIGVNYEGFEIIDQVESEDKYSFNDAETALLTLLRKLSDISDPVDLGDKWIGGTMSLQPADADLKAKDIPVETFFHKIVMVRDRLRVMEQRINSSNINSEEKVNLQQYISRIYGSLTTFNVLFKYKEDHFKGGGK